MNINKTTKIHWHSLWIKPRQAGLGIRYPFNKQTSGYIRKPCTAAGHAARRLAGWVGGPDMRSGRNGSLARRGHTTPLTSDFPDLLGGCQAVTYGKHLPLN